MMPDRSLNMEVIELRIEYTPFTNSLYGGSDPLARARLVRRSPDGPISDAPIFDQRSLRLRRDAAVRGAQDALAMIRVADTSLAEIETLITRMRALALYAASDTATYEDRLEIQREMTSYAEDVSRIASTTRFNGHTLLDGSAAAVWSSDRSSARALIGGHIRRANGSSAQGNYKISIGLIAPGVAETQQAGAFRIKIAADGAVGPGGGGAAPAPTEQVIAYNMPKGEYNLRVFPRELAPDSAGEDGRNIGVFASGGHFLYTDAGAYSGLVAEYYGNREFDASAVYDPDSGITFYDDALDNRAIFDGAGIDTLDLADGSRMNVQLYLKVIDKDDDANTVTFDVQARGLSEWGENVEFAGMTLTATTDGIAAQELPDIGIVVGDGFLHLDTRRASSFDVGDSFVLAMLPRGVELESIVIEGVIDQTWEDAWQAPSFWASGVFRLFGTAFAIDPDAITEGRPPVHFRAYYLDHDNGTLYDGDLVVQFGQHMFDGADEVPLVITFAGSQEEVEGYTHLIIARFRSDLIPEPEPVPDINEGTFDEIVLTDETLLTVSLGSGESTFVKLYKSDTVGAIADKLNDAVAHLVESKGRDPESFGHRFVDLDRDRSYDDVELEDGSKVFYGRFLFRTPLPGADGRIVIAGPEDFMRNFAPTVTRAAEESRYELSVSDAHTDAPHVRGVRITGSTAIGLLHDSVDVKFDPLADTVVTWRGDLGRFVLNKADGTYTTYVHLADRTTAFAAGEPVASDMQFSVGDLSSDALGISGLIVTTREEASRALSKLDAALAKTSALRARLAAADSRMSSEATRAMSGVSPRAERLDTSGAERMLAQMRRAIITSAAAAMAASADQDRARIAAIAALSSRAAHI